MSSFQGRRRRKPASFSRFAVGDIVFLVAAVAALVACVVGGGASRADAMSLLYLRPVIIVAIATMMFARAGRFDWASVRVPVLLLVILGGIMLLQLVPLPPAVWAALPGHAQPAMQLNKIGMADVWRPLSLVPELTLNSLLALLPPLAVLIGMAGANQKERSAIIYVFAGVGVVSALLGVVQLVSGHGYFYQYADDRLPIGFFTNRNHQAALLATCLPALRVISLVPRATRGSRLFQLSLCGALGLFLLLMILLTGSRSGMLMAVVGSAGAALMQPARWHRAQGRGKQRPWYQRAMIPIIVVLVPVMIVVLAYVSGRAVSINRFQHVDALMADQRVTFAPLTWHLAREFFPVGSGFGSFDRVYRMNEPDWALHQSYFNHAHNDIIEAIITGGFPFLILIVYFLYWWLKKSIFSFKKYKNGVPSKGFSIFGATGIAIILFSSLTDYPLRTPIIAAAMAIFCAILSFSKFDLENRSNVG